jgi:hypothetical protein
MKIAYKTDPKEGDHLGGQSIDEELLLKWTFKE